MVKWLLFTTLLILIVSSYAVCVSYAHPSQDIIKQEFILQNPDTEIIGIKLISDEVAIATYQIEFKKHQSREVSLKNLTLHQCINWDWKSNYRDCDKR